MEEEASDSEAPRPISSRTRSRQVKKSKKRVTLCDDDDPVSDDEGLDDDEAGLSDDEGAGATLVTRWTTHEVFLLSGSLCSNLVSIDFIVPKIISTNTLQSSKAVSDTVNHQNYT